MTLKFTSSVLVVLTAACSASDATPSWTGTIDTLVSGHVVVANTDHPVWNDATRWRIVEEFRLGSIDAEGPELFGNIASLEVDPEGRMFVLENQANELRVFDAEGRHVTTSGRSGGGPGEFGQPLFVQLGPDGNVWVADPQNNRLSVFDRSGNYLTSRQQPGGFVIMPWPGRFDDRGQYYSPVPRPTDEVFEIGLVRHDTAFNPIDTLDVPKDPVDRERFEHAGENGGFMIASVPHSAGFRWRLSPRGTFWGLFTGEYRLFEISQAGDTLRTITRAYDPLPVTAADRDSAVANLEWFTRQGGRIDRSKIPDYKPAAHDFFFDDLGNLWVEPVLPSDDAGRFLDVFDAVGRYLGRVELPFSISRRPFPVFRGSSLYAVTLDEFDVPFLVKARIEKPTGG